MAERELRCGICGSHFSSEGLLKEHFELEHPDMEYQAAIEKGLSDRLIASFGEHANRSALIGFFLGVTLTLSFLTAGFYLQDLMEEEVEVTVVTCGNCSYERFKTATDRMFEADYQEVDHKSQRGQDMIDKYELNYIPAFIYERDIEDRENFTQVRNSLVKFEDAYVMADRGERIAQRFGEGFSLRNQR